MSSVGGGEDGGCGWRKVRGLILFCVVVVVRGDVWLWMGGSGVNERLIIGVGDGVEEWKEIGRVNANGKNKERMDRERMKSRHRSN